MADPTNTHGQKWVLPGHSLVYLSNVCPASPVQARLCEAGEPGSIVSMYGGLGEGQPFGWNLVPLDLYLEGDAPNDGRLLFGSQAVKQARESQARTQFFAPVCDTGQCALGPGHRWHDMVAATIDRDVFIYSVHTTREQDQQVADWLNHQPNVDHYNPATNNCSDFTKSLINAVFPHSVHRDPLNDIGMTSPKAAARSFTLWAARHPHLGLYTLHFVQQPGEVRRSGPARSATETAIHMKKYLIPAIVIGDWELPTSFFASYIFSGRFGLYKSYEHYAVPGVAALDLESKTAKQSGNPARAEELKSSVQSARDQVLGSKREWQEYQGRFEALAATPEARPLAPLNRRKHFFPAGFNHDPVTVDADGGLWLAVESGGVSRQVGLGSRNLLSPESDPRLAFQLMLGRVAFELHARDRLRESLPEFKQDWDLLEKAQARLQPTQQAKAATPLAAAQP